MVIKLMYVFVIVLGIFAALYFLNEIIGNIKKTEFNESCIAKRRGVNEDMNKELIKDGVNNFDIVNSVTKEFMKAINNNPEIVKDYNEMMNWFYKPLYLKDNPYHNIANIKTGEIIQRRNY